MSGPNGEAARTAVVEAVGLTKRFGEIDVVKDLDLAVQAGEKVAIIGPSGSGKTTLLRCVAHLERPTAGYVAIDGARIGQKLVRGRWREMSDREIAHIRTGIGMVFQRFNLFPHLTALDNVMLGPIRVLRQSRAEAEPLARELLRKVGLAHKAGDYPERLSGGQQQRVAIARAIVADPTFLLCDEPTGDLDRKSADDVLHLLQVLNREHGKSIVMVTHDPKAAEFASHLLHVDKGSLLEAGSMAA
jgi:ABC-type polar amino acid transport system ATPase subunit